MVYPSIDNEPVVKDSKFNQSLFENFFKPEQTDHVKDNTDHNSEEVSIHAIDEIASHRDFEEEEDDQNPEIEDIDIDELPEFTENEDVIDWVEPPSADELTENEKQFYNSTKDLDLDEG